jgi:DNA-binding GntR family transcriptional regulator
MRRLAFEAMTAASVAYPDTPFGATAQDAIERRRSQTLVSICEAEIERMIFDGELERGMRINELTLAARLGVSRGPVREACRSLAQAGLLDVRANRGFFVRKLSRREVVDLYDLRSGLMRIAGEWIARRIRPEQLAALRAQIGAMDAACARGDIARFQQLNIEFHAALVDAADNSRLQSIYNGLAKELRLFRRRGLMAVESIEASNREHHAIVEAIAAGDPVRYAAAMEGHILRGKERFLAAAGAELDD